MARHRGKARHPVIIGGGVLLVAALGVGGAYAAMNGGDAAPVAPGADRTTTSSSTTSSGGPTSSGTTSSTAASTDATAVAALASCVATVRAQQGLATAVAASARDWGLHTDAQRKFDSGTFTLAQTKAQWAASKARGPADLAAYTRAGGAVTRAAHGCDGLSAAAAGSSVQVQAKGCTARSASLAAVARTGAVVHQQWATHLTMMAHKEHTSAAAYHDRWTGMVEDSGPALTAYRTAAAALARAPACTA